MFMQHDIDESKRGVNLTKNSKKCSCCAIKLLVGEYDDGHVLEDPKFADGKHSAKELATNARYASYYL